MHNPGEGTSPTMAPTSRPSSSSSSSAGIGSSVLPRSSPNVDPRDVGDRSYQLSAMRKMVSYLSSRGYGDASSLVVEKLVDEGPSVRDFKNIATFLFRRVEPTFGNQRSDEVVVLKFEDEVSMAFRCLGYPIPISETGLSLLATVESPSTWPALIAAIDWLVDLLVIQDEREPLGWGLDEGAVGGAGGRDAPTLDGSAKRIRAQFNKFLRKSYVAFLNDDNDKCKKLEGALLDSFQKDRERVDVYITGLYHECEKMREEIAVLNQEENG